MAKINIFSFLSNLQDFPTFSRFASACIDKIVREVNGNLNFVSNVEAAGPYTLWFASGAVTGVTHTLARVPTGFLNIKPMANATLYADTKAWTDKVIYLKASAGVTATIYVI